MKRLLFVLLVLAGLAALSAAPVLWAAPGQSPQRQTVPTRTPTAQPGQPTEPPQPPPASPLPVATDTPTTTPTAAALPATAQPTAAPTTQPVAQPTLEPAGLTATAYTLSLPLVGGQPAETAPAVTVASPAAATATVQPTAQGEAPVVAGGIPPLCFLGAALALLGVLLILFAARGRRGE